MDDHGRCWRKLKFYNSSPEDIVVTLIESTGYNEIQLFVQEKSNLHLISNIFIVKNEKFTNVVDRFDTNDQKTTESNLHRDIAPSRLIMIRTNGTHLSYRLPSYIFTLIKLPNRIAWNRLEHACRDRRDWSRVSPSPPRVSRDFRVEQLEASMESGWTVMRLPRDGSELLILGTVRIPAIRGDYQVGWYAPRRMWNPFFSPSDPWFSPL